MMQRWYRFQFEHELWSLALLSIVTVGVLVGSTVLLTWLYS